MSITFTPHGLYTEGQSCLCVDLYTNHGILLEGHDNCEGFIPFGERVPELNLANGNATHLFALLGITFDYSGVIDAADLLAHISVARKAPMVEYARSAASSSTLMGLEGALVYDAGLPEDRLPEYLNRLAVVANYALERNRQVQWA